MKKMLSTVGVFAVITAAVVVVIILCGGDANSQFVGLRCDVEKPEGEYENAAAVADFDDLMPVQYGAFVFDDGAVVDIWEVDPEYWGGEEYADRRPGPRVFTPNEVICGNAVVVGALPAHYHPSTVYALESGEVLLEVWQSYSGYNPDLIDAEVLAAGRSYVEAHPLFDLELQLRTAYNRLLGAEKRGDVFEFKTIEQENDLQAPEAGHWAIVSTADISGWGRNMYGSVGKVGSRELGCFRYVFDANTGKPLVVPESGSGE